MSHRMLVAGPAMPVTEEAIDALLVADVALVIDEGVEAEDQAGDEKRDSDGFEGEFAHSAASLHVTTGFRSV